MKVIAVKKKLSDKPILGHPYLEYPLLLKFWYFSSTLNSTKMF